MKIEVDKKSGFCFGVKNAISKAEEVLDNGKQLTCLGDIVHNREEVNRLSQLGMSTTSLDHISSLSDQTVLIRSHGEPPSTYETLKKQNNKLVDATCPVVLKLQQRVKRCWIEIDPSIWQLVIFGKENHPEVVGLNGQADNKAIVISTLADLTKLDFNRPIELFCQTTMSLDVFKQVKAAINERATEKVIIHDTICRQVAGRVPHLREFAKQYDLILFVSGKKSSNGKFLHAVCKEVNNNCYSISSSGEIDKDWLNDIESVGICGATSTPQWLMEEVKMKVTEMVG